MKKVTLALAAAGAVVFAACGQEGSEVLHTGKSTLPELLASCRLGDDPADAILVARESQDKLRFGSAVSALVSATRQESGDTVQYTLATAAGNAITIRLPYPVAGSGDVIILDRGVIGGRCTPDSIRMDLRALDRLVADAKTQPRYLFGQCSWNGNSGANITVRRGMATGTLVFEADLQDQGRGGESFAYVAHGLKDSQTDGSLHVSFEGEGNISWSGLGRHAATVTSLELTQPAGGTAALAMTNDSGFAPLTNCTINNLGFIRQVLGRP